MSQRLTGRLVDETAREVCCNPKEALKVEVVLVLSRITAIERVDLHEDAGPCPSRKVFISNEEKVEVPTEIQLARTCSILPIGTNCVEYTPGLGLIVPLP